jgi:nucleoid-associated protein YgaU
VRRPRAALRLGLAALAALAAASAVAESGGDAARAARSGVHQVSPGETLSRIAQQTLGDASLWVALYRANRDQIQDPARIYPGQKLAIPVVDPAEHDALRREAAQLTGQ